MLFSQFVNKTSKYLKSVRVLKNYISFDMIFPITWLMLKKYPNGIEILQNESQDSQLVTSFVCENKKELIDLLENTLDTVVKTNIEREEKEKLEDLKGLKFDMEELTKLLENEAEIDI